jgi:hypothetical protein
MPGVAAGQIVLSWTAATTTAGTITYTVSRSTTSGSETSIQTGLTGTSYTDTGLSNTKTYYYTVTAVNSNGSSLPSSEVFCTTGTPLTLSGLGVSASGTLNAFSYTGSGTGTGPSGGWSGNQQNWFYVSLNAGTNYTIVETQPSSALVAIQSSAGVQLNIAPGTGSALMTYQPSTTGTYTIICSGTSNQSFQLSVIVTVPLTVGTPYPGNLTTSSYLGGAANSSMAGVTVNMATNYTDWYTVALTAGQTYVISAASLGDTFLSLQNSAGTQVAWNDDSGLTWLGNTNGYAAQMVYTPTTPGTYTVIVSYDSGSPPISYTVTVANTAAPTPTPITIPGSGTFTSSGYQLSSASYFGPAAQSSMGSPPTLTAPATYGGTTVFPAWVDYEQNWYSVSLATGFTCTISMTMTAGNTPVLSLQDPNGNQVQFNYTASSTTATVNVTPATAGTYTIICSQAVSTNATTPFTLSVVQNLPSTTTTITAPAVSSPANGSVTVTVTSPSTSTPTGNVTLTDTTTNTTYGPTALTSGSVSFTITSPSVGTHNLSASYAPGSAGFQSSMGTGSLVVNLGPVPSAPTGLSAMPGPAAGQMVLSWTGSTGVGTITYTVSRGVIAGSLSSVKTGITGTTYTDIGLGNTTGYFYIVTAVNVNGSSTPSNEVNSTTGTPITLTGLGSGASGTVNTAYYNGSGTAAGPVGGWSGHEQSWFYVSLTAGTTYTIAETQAVAGNSSVMALQDATGAQLGAVVTGTPTAILTYTPTATGTYTIIASTAAGAVTQNFNVSVITTIPLTIGTPYPGNLTTSSYPAIAASTALSGNNIPLSNFSDWYTVNLTAGLTYVISTMTSADTVLSLQNSSGTQVAWNNDSGLTWLGNSSGAAAQIVYTPTTSDTYTVIVSYDTGSYPFSYSLLAANPSPPTPTSITIPASGTFTSSGFHLSSSSYFGTGAAGPSAPPTITAPTASLVGTTTFPAWVDYQQNWYSVPLTAGYSYTISMAMASGSPVVSLQNGATQVGFASSTSPASFTYPCTTSGTFTVICSQATSTNVTAPFTLTISPPATTTTITPATATTPTDGFVTVTVTAAAGTPSGNVTLTDTTTSTTYGPTALSGGTVTFDISNPAEGSHSLSASYVSSGSPPQFQPSNSTGTLTVPSTTSTIITAPTINYPSNATVTVSVVPAASSTAPTGSVTLVVDGNSPGTTMALSASGSSGAATFTLPGLSAATHYLTASYTGAPGSFFASTATPASVVVNPPASLGPIPVNLSASLSASSYTGTAGGTGLNGYAQNWYTVSLNSGLLYTITMNGNNPSVVLLNSGGSVVAQNSSSPAQIFYTPSSAGTYTVICTQSSASSLTGSQTSPFSLTIPSPAPSTPTLITATVPVSVPGTLSASSYQGSAASTAVSGAYNGIWTGHFQDWYSVNLTAGSTYVIAMATAGNSLLSIQDGTTGIQVEWNDDFDESTGKFWSQIVFTPAATKNYTIICGTYAPETALTYTLLIQNPLPSVTSVTVPYSQTQTIGDSSYYGAAASSAVNSPAAAPTPNPSATIPGWVNHEQNWYSVSLSAFDTYTITMTLPATGAAVDAPVLSIQDSSGDQLAFVMAQAGNASVSLVFQPQTTDTYTVICSRNGVGSSTGPTNGTLNFTLSIPNPVVPLPTTTTISAPMAVIPNNATVTVTVSASGATPTGSVSLIVDGGTAMTQTLSNGKATFTITAPTAGSHTVAAIYTGNEFFLQSSASGGLAVGIPNVKLAPPVNRNCEFALRLTVEEPVRHRVEIPAPPCWISSSSGCRNA